MDFCKQIYALNNSSLAVFKDNKIVVWGNNKEGFHTTAKTLKDEDYALDYIKLDKVTGIIYNEILKSDDIITENFINTRKLFYSKFNQIVQENFEKENRIKTIQNHINSIKNNLELKKNSAQVILHIYF